MIESISNSVPVIQLRLTLRGPRASRGNAAVKGAYLVAISATLHATPAAAVIARGIQEEPAALGVAALAHEPAIGRGQEVGRVERGGTRQPVRVGRALAPRPPRRTAARLERAGRPRHAARRLQAPERTGRRRLSSDSGPEHRSDRLAHLDCFGQRARRRARMRSGPGAQPADLGASERTPGPTP